MPAIQATNGAQRALPETTASHALEGPSLRLPEDGVYALGVEFIAAALASRAAEATVRVAREARRAEKLAEASEAHAQAGAMREKASASRSSAWVSATLTVAGGACGAASAGTLASAGGVDRASKLWGAAGTTLGGVASPMGTLSGGARVAQLEAKASQHASVGKAADACAEELATLERQARSIVEKASSVMQALVQDRQAVSRAVLRAG